MSGERDLTTSGRIRQAIAVHVTDPNGLTLFAHVVPPGLPAFRGAAGWSVSGRGTKWTYRDRDGMTAHGIARARVHVREGEVRVSITGKRGTFPVAANRLPVGVTVALGNGPCASAAFGTTECWHTGSAVSCR